MSNPKLHKNKDIAPETTDNALVITGKSVHYALKDFADEFLQLSSLTESVICCRMAPAQKADIVRLVRKRKEKEEKEENEKRRKKQGQKEEGKKIPILLP